MKLDPAMIYLFKVNNRNTRKRCQICSKLTIKIPERRHKVIIEVAAEVVLVFLSLTLKIFDTFFSVFIVYLEQAY